MIDTMSKQIIRVLIIDKAMSIEDKEMLITQKLKWIESRIKILNGEKDKLESELVDLQSYQG